jgi:DNA-binding HxlR family transcriptional regulator
MSESVETADVENAEDDCLAVWCDGDEWCAVTCTMEVLGKKWHPVIVHRLLERDALRFNELADDVGAITNKVLSDSLDDLEDKELVDREIVSEKPVAVEYSLTERGRSLEPVIDALESWGEAHLRPAETADESAC